MQLFNNWNKNEYKIMIILIKAGFFHRGHLFFAKLILSLFIVIRKRYFLGSDSQRIYEVIPKELWSDS